MSSTALVPEVISNAEQYGSAVQRWTQHEAHVISPLLVTSYLAPDHQVAASVVHIDPETDAYHSRIFHQKGEKSLSKVGLDKIAAAVGLSWEPSPASGRRDDRKEPHYCEWEVTGTYKSPDGAIQRVTGSSCCDFRDGSDQIKGLTPGNIAALRRKILERCESLAKNRAIRSIGVHQKYSEQELEKPFVACRVVYVPPDDPDVRKMIAAQNLGVVDQLYGGPAALPAADAGAGVASPAPTDKGEPDPLDDLPEAEEEESISEDIPPEEVTFVGKTGKSVDGALYFCTVKGRGKEKLYITDPEVARALVGARKDRKLVEVELEQRGENLHVLEVKVLDQEVGS